MERSPLLNLRIFWWWGLLGLGFTGVEAAPVPYWIGDRPDQADPTKAHFTWELKTEADGVLLVDTTSHDPNLPGLLGIPASIRLPVKRDADSGSYVARGDSLNQVVEKVVRGMAPVLGLVAAGEGAVTDVRHEVTEIRLTPGKRPQQHLLNLELRLRLILTLDSGKEKSFPPAGLSPSIPFVASPSRMKPAVAADVILSRFGELIPQARRNRIQPENSLKFVTEEELQRTARQLGVGLGGGDQGLVLPGRADGVWALVLERAPPGSVIHEMVQVYGNPEFRQLGELLYDGTGHFLAKIAMNDPTGRHGFDFSVLSSEAAELAYTGLISRSPSLELLMMAYFGEGEAEVSLMRTAYDQKNGEGAFDAFLREQAR